MSRPAFERLLVTGGAGFIGANFVQYWLRAYPGARLVVLDRLSYAGNLDSLSPVLETPGLRFVQGDIADADRVSDLLREENIDCLVHFAAESHVDRSISAPDEFIHANVIGTHTLLKCACAEWRRNGRGAREVRFHHVSTDEVYGSLSAEAAPFSEASAYAPNSPYSASKAAADHLVRAYHHTYGLPVTTSNCSNNYGPYQFPEKLIPLMLVNALEGRRLPVYGEGANIRDWLYVEDHCRALERILCAGRVGETYNLGGCNEWRNLDIVRLLCALIERRFRADGTLRERFPHCPAALGGSVAELIEFVTDRAGHDFRYAIDARKARRELGFEPAERFETGIEKTVDWYLRHERWWRDVLSGAYRAARR